ncbi:MAG: DHH family phosphoesterase [Clostridia bacterium]|nr:DHH family phosphoesterase [Clostridia bacterium]
MMKGKKNGWIIPVLVMILAAGSVGGYFAGESAAASRYQAQREKEILLIQSEWEGLGEIEGPIYVTGHKSPDSDTVGSAIAYAAFLRSLGYDAQPVVLGSVNHETQYILDAAKLDTPPLLEDASGCNIALVDHSEYLQSADGLEAAHIISIIDHHGDGTVQTGNPLIYDARPLGATATIIWLRYRAVGLLPDQQTALVMMGAILSDTKNLQSEATTFADREALRELSGIAGISDTDAFYSEMYKALLSYEGMTDEEIYFSDYKEYETKGRKYGIACMRAYDEESAKDLADRMKALFPSVLASTGMDMAFVKISISHDDLSVAYLMPSNDAAAEVLEAAFGETAVFDGTSYMLMPSISRKTVMVPAITDVLKARPAE